MSTDYQPTTKGESDMPSVASIERQAPLPTNDTQRMAQAIVFSTLIVCGVAVFAIVVFSNIDWYLPTLGYGLAVYLACVKFLKS